MKQFKERIRWVRKCNGITQEEFAKKLKLSKNYVWQIEKEGRKPSDRTLADICRIFGISYDWLVYGEGEMYQDDDSDAQAIIDAVIQGDNEFAKRTLVAFAKLDLQQWELIRNLVKEIGEDI